MKAGSLPDDDAVALRESRASPSLGEVCLEVCSRYVSLCFHLFFSMNMIRISLDWRKVMTTCYFDRNVFDQIDRKRDITDGDLTVLRKAIRDDQLSVLVSFETVQETSYAKKDTALRGLWLIQELARA